MLEIKNLSKSFGELKVLKSISFSVESGEVIGILGKNGAGKTTLFEAIYQAINYQGLILYNSNSIERKDISYVETENYFYPYMLAEEYLDLFGAINSRLVLEKNGLPTKTYIDHFSTGMKKKLAILAALLLDRSIIVLDEPFNGLDFESVEYLYQLIKNFKSQGKIIILSSHILETLTNSSDRIIYLKNGTIDTTIESRDFHYLKTHKNIFFEF